VNLRALRVSVVISFSWLPVAARQKAYFRFCLAARSWTNTGCQSE
jgi:hypothetical protein